MARHTKPHIAQRKTLLAVGEGKADAAFLKYLRGIYCSGRSGVKVTVRDASGKGPSNVIGTAIGALRISSYDKKLCLLDTDLEWTKENKSDAKRKKIELVGSTPCLPRSNPVVRGAEHSPALWMVPAMWWSSSQPQA